MDGGYPAGPRAFEHWHQLGSAHSYASYAGPDAPLHNYGHGAQRSIANIAIQLDSSINYG